MTANARRGFPMLEKKYHAQSYEVYQIVSHNTASAEIAIRRTSTAFPAAPCRGVIRLQVGSRRSCAAWSYDEPDQLLTRSGVRVFDPEICNHGIDDREHVRSRLQTLFASVRADRG